MNAIPSPSYWPSLFLYNPNMARLKSPKNKGDAYERELAAYLNSTVLPTGTASRAPLSGGGMSFNGAGQADLLGTPGLHVEAKRVERLEVYKSLDQAERSVTNRNCPETPVVISRRNNTKTGDSIVILRLDQFLTYYHAWLKAEGLPHI